MALADLLPQPETVQIGKGTVEVRALTLIDISTLLRIHSADLEEAAALFSELQSAPTERGAVHMILEIVTKAPGLAANIIAIAAGEDDAADLVERLPMTAQVEILQVVARLTFDDYGGPGKFWAVLSSLLGGLGVTRNLPAAGPPMLNS